MNETTEKLIRDLAAKFGTTTEHLWGVLLKQASITGYLNSGFYLFFSIIFVFIFRFLYKKYKTGSFDEDIHGFIHGFSLVFTCFSLFFLSIVFFLTVHDTIACFTNPEYWALKQLLPR